MTAKKCLVAIVLGVIGTTSPIFDLSAAFPALRNRFTHRPLPSSNPYRLSAAVPPLSEGLQLNLRPVPELNPELIGALLVGFVGWHERKRLVALLG